MSERDRLEGRRDRFFVAFGRLGVERPKLVSGFLIVLTLVGALFATQLTISTSRFAMVEEDNWYQHRMLEFFEAFGYPDAPLAIVEGGTPEQRRARVDQLVEALEREPMFEGRVLAKFDAELVAETLLVQQPGALGDFRRQLPEDADLPAAFEHGLEGIFGLLETQMLAALDGEIEADIGGADAQLAQLAQLAKGLDDKLATDAGQGGEGVDPAADLLASFAGGDSELVPSEAELATRGLDAEGYLVSNDGEYLLVAIAPEFGGDSVAEYAPAVERLRAIRDELPAIGETKVVFTGLPFLVVDEEATLAAGLLQSSVVAGLGIFLLLVWAFRSVRRTAVALLPITIGTVVALGIMYLLYDSLDPITSSFAAVLMGLSIDFSVHLLVRYDEDLRAGMTRGEALLSSLRTSGPGVVTGAVTTALAFLTVATTEFTSYAQMGVITAVGLGIALVSALLVLPVVLGRGDLSEHETPAKAFEGLRGAVAVARKAPFVVVISGVVLAIAGAIGLPDYDPAYSDLMPSYESTDALHQLEADGAMSPWFAWTTAADVEAAREQAAVLREYDSVGRVDSPSDILPELDAPKLARLRADFEGLARDPDWSKLAAREADPRALAGRAEAIADALDELAFAAEGAGRDTKSIEAAAAAFTALGLRLESVPTERAAATLREIEGDMARLMGPAWSTARTVAERGHWLISDLPGVFEMRFAAEDGSGRMALFAYPAQDLTESNHDEGARDFTLALESVDPQAAGQGVSLFRHNAMILKGFKRASLFSISLVVLLLLLDFASIRKALLALVPVLIGMGWMLGLYSVFGLEFNVATIMVLPLMLGIGVDSGVHMVHRWDLNQRFHGGRAKLDEVVGGTGSAVLLSSLTTMVGFVGLLFGKHLGMIQLGATMIIGIGCTLISSVVFLPALLLALDQAE